MGLLFQESKSTFPQMMVAEFADRQNNSPANGETPLDQQRGGSGGGGPSSGGGPNTVSGGAVLPSLSSPGQGYFLISEQEMGSIPRDSDLSSNHSEQSQVQLDSYSNNGFEVNSHLPRKDLFSQRKQREFIPDNKKDESYWDRRRRNNEAAKRSREKRRYNDMILEQRVVELSKENHFLKAQLSAIKERYGISGESVVNVEQVMATLPTNDQVLSITKRAKLGSTPMSPQIVYPQTSMPIPTPVIHRTSNTGPSPPLVNLAPVYQDTDSFQENDRYPFPFPPVLPPLNPPVLEAGGNSVLNLSRSRARVGSPSPYDLPLTTSGATDAPMSGSCLPHKLRHKSHLGDKDVAATALLSLQAIKQEPAPARASPPWDGEGSSDERDSGISLGAEWIISSSHGLSGEAHPPVASPISHDIIETEDVEDCHLKSEVARLASEVASLKSMLSRKKSHSLTID